MFLGGQAGDDLKRRCGVVCHALFVCFFFAFGQITDNRPTRAGAALRAAPSERGWAIRKRYYENCVPCPVVWLHPPLHESSKQRSLLG